MGDSSDAQRDQGDAQQGQSQTGGTGQRGDQQGGQRGDQQGGDPAGTGLVDWFTETFLRAAVAILGLLLLLFALGQIAGVDMIGVLGDLLTTEVVQWSLVAAFALLLIVAASKSWNISTGN